MTPQITTKEYSIRKLKKIRGNEGYENFLKHSTLTNTGNEEEIEGTIHDDDIRIKTNVVQLTDAELFAACGGRTAHKGARHGHSMKSKISRLEAQEQALLEQMLKSKKDLEEKDRNGFIKRKVKVDVVENTEVAEETPKKKKKSKSKNCDTEITDESVPEECISKKKKKSKSKDEVQESESVVEEMVPKKKKKSRNTEITEDEEPSKKKKKAKDLDEEENCENKELEVSTISKSKKKKSKRNKSD